MHFQNAEQQKASSMNWLFVVDVVGRVGFEPTTNWLKANCSTN